MPNYHCCATIAIQAAQAVQVLTDFGARRALGYNNNHGFVGKKPDLTGFGKLA